MGQDVAKYNITWGKMIPFSGLQSYFIHVSFADLPERLTTYQFFEKKLFFITKIIFSCHFLKKYICKMHANINLCISALKLASYIHVRMRGKFSLHTLHFPPSRNLENVLFNCVSDIYASKIRRIIRLTHRNFEIIEIRIFEITAYNAIHV